VDAQAACRHDINAAAGGYIRVYGNVGEPLCQAILKAVKRVPKPHRKLLHRLSIGRDSLRAGPGVGGLIDRLARESEFARYYRGDHTLLISDAGVRRPDPTARWTGGPVSASDWAALERLVGPVAGAVSPMDLRSAPGLLDKALQAGVAALWGGPVKLEDVLLHMFGQVVLLAPRPDDDPLDRARRWAALSGWTDDDAVPGYTMRREARPTAIVRAVFSGKAAGRYRPGPGSRLVTPLARLSPRADFGEAYRVAWTTPSRLTRLDPAKALALTALGWAADREREVPGPAATEAASTALAAGARALLNGETGLAAEDAVAIVKAHAAALGGVVLPAHLVATRPPDLPEAVSADLPDQVFELLVGETVVRAAPKYVNDTLVRAAVHRWTGESERVQEAVDLDTAGKSKQAMAQVRAMTGDVFGARARAAALVKIAARRLSAGMWTPVDSILDKVLAAARQVPVAAWRAELLYKVAYVNAAAGLYDRGLAVLEELGKAPVAQRYRARLLAEIAFWRAREGSADEGRALLKRAEVAASGLRPLVWQREVAAAIAAARASTFGMDVALEQVATTEPALRAAVLQALAARAEPHELKELLAFARSAKDVGILVSLALKMPSLVDEAAKQVHRVRGPARRTRLMEGLALVALDRNRKLGLSLAARVDRRYAVNLDPRGLVAAEEAVKRNFTVARKLARLIADRHHRARIEAVIDNLSADKSDCKRCVRAPIR